MALPEESEIMSEIGLGQHYTWWNGSGSCGPARRDAAARVEEKLALHDCRPDRELIDRCKLVARDGEESEFVLTRTWQVLSDVIQWHLHVRSGGVVTPGLQKVKEKILETYRASRRYSERW